MRGVEWVVGGVEWVGWSGEWLVVRGCVACRARVCVVSREGHVFMLVREQLNTLFFCCCLLLFVVVVVGVVEQFSVPKRLLHR